MYTTLSQSGKTGEAITTVTSPTTLSWLQLTLPCRIHQRCSKSRPASPATVTTETAFAVSGTRTITKSTSTVRSASPGTSGSRTNAARTQISDRVEHGHTLAKAGALVTW